MSHTRVLLPSCLGICLTLEFYYPPVYENVSPWSVLLPSCLCMSPTTEFPINILYFCSLISLYVLYSLPISSFFTLSYTIFDQKYTLQGCRCVLPFSYLLRKILEIISGFQCDASSIISRPSTTFIPVSHYKKSQH